MNPYQKVFVVSTGLNFENGRTMFEGGIRSVQKRLLDEYGLKLGTWYTAHYAVVPDGTVAMRQKRIPFITWSDLVNLVAETGKPPAARAAKSREELGLLEREYDNSWSKMIDHVREQLSLRPQNLDHPVWTALKHTTWCSFLDALVANKWRFQRLLYRAARSWMLRMLEQLRLGIEIWTDISDRVDLSPPPVDESATVVHKRLFAQWDEKRNQTLMSTSRQKWTADDLAYVTSILAGLVTLRAKVEWVTRIHLPFQLKVWTERTVRCYVDNCNDDDLSSVEKGGVARIHKPVFLYLQELVLALLDYDLSEGLQKLRTELLTWKAFPASRVEESFGVLNAQTSFQDSYKPLMRLVLEMQTLVRQRLNIRPDVIVLWSELAEMALSSGKFTHDTLKLSAIPAILKGVALSDEQEHFVSKLGEFMNSSLYKVLIDKRVYWVLPADSA